MADSLSDVISALNNLGQTVGLLARTLGMAFPVAALGSSPIVTARNDIGTTGSVVLQPNPSRRGVVFHNPGSTNDIYVYPSTVAATTTNLGGSFQVMTGGYLMLPSALYANDNIGWSALALTGATNPLSILEFM